MQFSFAQSFSHRQSMVVTAQLQQAIKLLQMGNTELRDFIESQADENPFVELRLPRPALPVTRGAAAAPEDWDRIAALPDTHRPSLYAHVERHVDGLALPPRQARIAGAFIDALEPCGWLGRSLPDVAAAAGVELAEAEAVLMLLQKIEPAGLFARNLAECLRLQAAAQQVLDPVLAAVLEHLPLVAAANMAGLARACGVPQEALRPALRMLRSFDPKPGAQFQGDDQPLLPPDLIARETSEGWVVELNRATLPGVVIRRDGAAVPQAGARGAEAGRYAAERLSVARWLARAIAHRNETALKIGAEILRRQTDFLEHGPAQLKPMTLREVADMVGVHESTVSRVCAGMMMATPQGCFPLKHFFTAALIRNDGGTDSAGAARHRISSMIRAEDPRKPLSDDEIARRMSDDGIAIARRTVAKYREMLHIPTSSDRRRRASLQAQSR